MHRLPSVDVVMVLTPVDVRILACGDFYGYLETSALQG